MAENDAERVPRADPAQLDAFFRRLAEAPSAVLFLDYDGTLAPFVVDRDEARPYPGVVERLENLPRTRLVMVSGRRAAQVVELLGLDPPPEAWGAHGLERLAPGGTPRQRPLPPEAHAALRRAEAWAAAHRLGERVERKPGCIALHFRGLPTEEARRLERAARADLAPLDRPPMRLIPFDGGLELRARAANKAEPVRVVLDEEPDALAAYLGDDLTDEDAFAALRAARPDGLAVLVRAEPRPSRAHLRLTPPHELFAFLDRWRDVRRPRP